MDSKADTWRAFGLAMLVHLACVGAILIGLLWTSTTRSAQAEGPVIEASLVDFTAKPLPTRSQPRPSAAKVTPPKPKPAEAPAPKSEQPKPAEQKRSEDRIDQEKVRLAADALEKAEKEQEERIRKEQIDLTQPEDELSRMERERQKQLEDIRKQREEAEQKRKLEEQRLAQLQDANKQKLEKQQREQEAARMAALAEQEAQRAGAQGQDNSLQAQYIAAIQAKVTANWLRPETIASVRCKVRIVQLPGGAVLQANVVPPCYADEITMRSMEAAVMRSDPLPYRGFESVFSRTIDFTFCYPENLCRS